MKLTRDFTSKIRYLMDEYTPPILRDSKWFMYIPFKVLFGKEADTFFNFKNNALSITDQQFADIYRKLASYSVERTTDLNELSFNKILQNLSGANVLEVGCGNAYLASKIAESKSIAAVDIVINKEVEKKYPNIKFVEGNSENLPFANKSFDTVICTHTLEHVRNLQKSISELRRVCSKRLIIVVPQQRPYKYTFDLHLHFFPYPSSLLAYMGTGYNNSCESCDGDLFYIENY